MDVMLDEVMTVCPKSFLKPAEQMLSLAISDKTFPIILLEQKFWNSTQFITQEIPD